MEEWFRIYSVWPLLLCWAALLALAASPLFAAVRPAIVDNRRNIAAIEGLRGFLALMVFFHHAAINHDRMLGHGWVLPTSIFYAEIGPFGVAIFFMIAGFLFWGRLIREAGRPRWILLYIGRIFRIGPVYLFALACVVAIVFGSTGFHLRVPFGQFCREVLAWLPLGFTIGGPINDFPDPNIVFAGVTWSLRYEWMFYASLPLLALAARHRRTHLPFAVAGLVVALSWEQVTGDYLATFCALFCVGLSSASLLERQAGAAMRDDTASLLVVALLAVFFLIFPTPYHAGAVLLLGVAFFLIASGASLFGLLTCRAARRLGDISYCIYLLQGIVLAMVAQTPLLRRFALTSPLRHWIIVALEACVLVTFSMLVHVAVERPGIALGRQVARHVTNAFGTIRVRMRSRAALGADSSAGATPLPPAAALAKRGISGHL